MKGCKIKGCETHTFIRPALLFQFDRNALKQTLAALLRCASGSTESVLKIDISVPETSAAQKQTMITVPPRMHFSLSMAHLPA